MAADNDAVSPDTHTGRHVPASVRGRDAHGTALSLPNLAPGGVTPTRRALPREEFIAIAKPILEAGGCWKDVAREFGISGGAARDRGRCCGLRTQRRAGATRIYFRADIEALAEMVRLNGLHFTAGHVKRSANAVRMLLARNGYSSKGEPR